MSYIFCRFTKQEANGRKTTRILNEEVLIKVMTNLDFIELICLRRVSNQFLYCVNEVLKQERVLQIGWNPYAFHSYHCLLMSNSMSKTYMIETNDHMNPNSVNIYTKRLIGLRQLILNTRLTDETIEVFVKNCVNVIALYLKGYTLELNATKLETFGNGFGDRVKTLSLIYWNKELNEYKKSMALLKSFLNLKTLVIQQFNGFGDMFDSIPNQIQRVCLYCQNGSVIDYQSFKNFLSRTGNSIKDLVLSFPLNEEDLEVIERKCNLRKLCSDFNRLSLLDLIDSQTSLRCLGIRKMTEYILNFEQVFHRRYCFATIERLELSDLHCRRSMNVKSFQLLIKIVPNLRILVLDNFLVTCDCVMRFWKYMTICDKCSDYSSQVLYGFKSLKTLHLNRVNVEVKSIELFPKLRRLLLTTNQGIDLYTESVFGQLKNFCIKHPKEYFTLGLRILDNTTTEMFQNSPKNLRIVYYF